MNHHRLPLLAQRVLNTPLAIHPQKAEVILAALGHRFGIGAVVPDISALSLYDDDDAPTDRHDRYEDPGYDLCQGVAIVPIEGTLVQKNGCVRAYSGLTGYDGTRAAFLAALADPDARAIVLDIDSPGGEVNGCFDLADTIFAARGRKPIWAVCNEVAFSAAYALASAADVVTVPRTGGVGSIGVIAVLVEMSGLLKAEGVTVNIVQFGARKSDGNPYQALAPEARARFQATVDATGKLFAETVARNRGMAAAAVRDTEASTFHGADAIASGLADMLAAPDAAFRELLTRLPAA